MNLDGDVKNMMKQLKDAENELQKKNEEAMQDMMMATMVNINWCLLLKEYLTELSTEH